MSTLYKSNESHCTQQPNKTNHRPLAVASAGGSPPQPKLTAIKTCDHYIEEHYKIKEVRAPRNNQEHSLMPLDDSPVIHTLY